MTGDGSIKAEGERKTDGGEKLAIEIVTRPSPQDWLGYVLGFVVYTAVAAILPLLLLHWYSARTLSGGTPIVPAIFVVVICAGGAFWFVRRSLDKQVWRLTDSELIAGSSGHNRYPLDTIQKIVMGLPRELGATPVHKSALQERKSVDAYLQSSALLVMFQDGSMLPLRIRFLENGTALINDLTTRFHHLVVQDYKYSESEIAVLKKAEPNRLIPGRHKATPAPAVGIATVTSSTPLPPQPPPKTENKEKGKPAEKDKSKTGSA